MIHSRTDNAGITANDAEPCSFHKRRRRLRLIFLLLLAPLFQVKAVPAVEAELPGLGFTLAIPERTVFTVPEDTPGEVWLEADWGFGTAWREKTPEGQPPLDFAQSILIEFWVRNTPNDADRPVVKTPHTVSETFIAGRKARMVYLEFRDADGVPVEIGSGYLVPVGKEVLIIEWRYRDASRKAFIDEFMKTLAPVENSEPLAEPIEALSPSGVDTVGEASAGESPASSGAEDKENTASAGEAAAASNESLTTEPPLFGRIPKEKPEIPERITLSASDLPSPTLFETVEPAEPGDLVYAPETRSAPTSEHQPAAVFTNWAEAAAAVKMEGVTAKAAVHNGEISLRVKHEMALPTDWLAVVPVELAPETDIDVNLAGTEGAGESSVPVGLSVSIVMRWLDGLRNSGSGIGFRDSEGKSVVFLLTAERSQALYLVDLNGKWSYFRAAPDTEGPRLPCPTASPGEKGNNLKAEASGDMLIFYVSGTPVRSVQFSLKPPLDIVLVTGAGATVEFNSLSARR